MNTLYKKIKSVLAHHIECGNIDMMHINLDRLMSDIKLVPQEQYPDLNTDEAKMSAEAILQYYHSSFKVLFDWEISFEDSTRYTDQCCWNRKTKKALIYPKTNPDSIDQYIYHEILHICHAALKGGSYKDKKEKEETFIQDLCRIKDNASQFSQREVTEITDEEINREIGKRYYMKDYPHDLEEGFIEGVEWAQSRQGKGIDLREELMKFAMKYNANHYVSHISPEQIDEYLKSK